MRALFIIDPIEKLNPYKDSSIDMMAIAQARGHTCAYCTKDMISAGAAGVFAHTRSVHLTDDARQHTSISAERVQVGAATWEDLSAFDAVFIRPDPPFDDHYVSLTLLLEPLEEHVQFVNSPRGVRAVSEKLSALNFPEAIPPTLATYQADDARRFAQAHEQVVLKPSYFGSGTGIAISSASDPDFDEAIAKILALAPHGPVIVQGFLPEVAKGDVRMMVVDGEPVGTLGRKPAEGEFRANIAAGGTEMQIDASPRQLEIAAQVGPYLRQNGILFAGLDFIGDYLIELNVTSPTLIQQLRRLGGPDISKMIWKHLEQSAP